ncbi:glycosyltransferase family 9 protein [Paraburkholderia terrae]|uniref:glycosyltransferase family 9 protein n=1 Tax=Paraburkholderia terrae TaxID=311230 RepID=UPI001EE351F6|nr:glycosyltransferase family 9 protein [Paraburkholderia terrae]GJH04547.1 glycosyltransferase family 9 protein [Paraburkholderia terrae]
MMKSLATVPQPLAAHATVAAAAPLAPWGDDIKRILCVRTDNLGDVLMTTPAFHALRAACPDRRLTLLTSAAGAAVAPFLPDVDDVIRYDAPWAGRRPPRTHPADLAMRVLLEERHFDAAVIFTVYSQSPLPAATVCYMAGIRRRLARCRENPYALVNDWVRETEPERGVRHEVERQLTLVGAVGALTKRTNMRMRLRDIDRTTLAAIMARRAIDPARPYAIIHPGASAESRRYPAERFGEVAERIVRMTDMNIFVTGNAAEALLARTLIDAAGPRVRPFIHDLTDAFELGAFAALIERAAVTISNNSGPVHIASALGAPVVDLYALTNPQHGPWQTPHRILFNDVECRWCYRSACPEAHHACLRGIPSVEVANAALELVDETRRTAHRAQPVGRGFATHTE